MTSLAVIFDNFGPYHLARLRAAAAISHLTAIEVASVSDEYAWQPNPSAPELERLVLVDDGNYRRVSRAQLRRRVAAALEKAQPEVVAIPGWTGTAALAAIEWCVRRRVPAICMSESTEHDHPRTGFKERSKGKILRLFSSALVGGNLHRAYLTKLGMPFENISLGYDVVDNDHFATESGRAKAQSDKIRKDYQLPEKYFLSSARFIEKKNLPRLLDAYALYRQKSPAVRPWSLVLLGDGPLRPALELRLDALHLRDHVLLPGFRQYADLPAYYAFAGAFILASTIEPWGLVVNEAMASGLPILVSNRCGCVPELVEEGVNGYLFDPLNIEDMAEKMVQLSASEIQIPAFAQASCKRVAAWSPQRFVTGLSQAMRTALAGPKPSPRLSDQILLWLLQLR